MSSAPIRTGMSKGRGRVMRRVLAARANGASAEGVPARTSGGEQAWLRAKVAELMNANLRMHEALRQSTELVRAHRAASSDANHAQEMM